MRVLREIPLRTQAHRPRIPSGLRGVGRIVAVVGAAIGLLPSGALGAGDPSRAGAYCPFPAKGEKPVCFTEVEREYSDFIAAVDSGKVDDPEVAELERALQQGGESETRALALSSLAYGYFMLAERAASEEAPDPALVARLESWNQLLSSVYADAESEPRFRTAVRRAAVDLHERAPAVPSSDDECEGSATGDSCRTTSGLLAALKRIDDPDADTGVRGALGRLLGRMFDDDDEVLAPASDDSAAAPR